MKRKSVNIIREEEDAVVHVLIKRTKFKRKKRKNKERRSVGFEDVF